MNALIPAIYLAMFGLNLGLAIQHPHDALGVVYLVFGCIFLAIALDTLRRYWRDG